jgi:hypothetical protein
MEKVGGRESDSSPFNPNGSFFQILSTKMMNTEQQLKK